jgi:hypothetical protein
MLVLVITPFGAPIEGVPGYARLLVPGEVVELPDLDVPLLVEAGYVSEDIPPGWLADPAGEDPQVHPFRPA